MTSTIFRRSFHAARTTGLLTLLSFLNLPLLAQGKPVRVEIRPDRVETEVGQKLKFTASAYDETGTKLDATPTAWFAAPYDMAAVSASGEISFTAAGEVRIGVLIGGQQGSASVTVKPQSVRRIQIEESHAVVPVGTVLALHAVALTATAAPRTDVPYVWSSQTPAVATVDPTGLVTGIVPGAGVIQVSAGPVAATVRVDVVENPVRSLSVEPAGPGVRTGDVIRFRASAKTSGGAAIDNPVVRWAIAGNGAAIGDDGVFVAELPGTYTVMAISGDRIASATISVDRRGVERAFEVVGRTPQEAFQAGEEWINGNFAYLTSLLPGELWVYDISNPAHPEKVASIRFDARIINDVSTTPDGKIAVITREGASNRKNGIVFLDTSDPRHPTVLSEYTETVTGGVHSAYINTHYVYATDDATGSLRVIDFLDPRHPREVARWQVNGEGRMLHDLQVIDGLAYLAYWRDGMIVLDVGNGIKGGSPEKPQFVSRLSFDYTALYGSGWLAGAHTVFRYRNYVFLGDEVFPSDFDLDSRDRIPVKGFVHVVDVSDLLHPREVASYEVPEAGSHNLWVANDVMYIGYYNGGARAVDVSGDLRGNLYRQGREIARMWTGDPKGFRPNLPFTWGAQPQGGLIYYNDIHTGIWILKLVDRKDRPN